jgi:gas vesicle protein
MKKEETAEDKFYNDYDEVGADVGYHVEQFLDGKAEEVQDMISKHKEELRDLLQSLLDDLKDKYPDVDENELKHLIDEQKYELLSHPMYSCREFDWRQSLDYDVKW